MSDNDDLSYLVEETIKLQSRGSKELNCLESRLNDYGVDFLKGTYISSIQMIRFHCPFGVLDIPINLSLFDFANTNRNWQILDEVTDPHHFFKVISKEWNQSLKKMLLIKERGCFYIAGLDKTNLASLENILLASTLQEAA